MQRVARKIAIVGYSFRLPGPGGDGFWQALRGGADLVTKVDPSRWEQATFLHPRKDFPGTSYTFAAGSVGDISGFDAAFFGVSPREAEHMDPQQRLLLELSWETCENGGIRPSKLRGSHCGVYIGLASTDYALRCADDLAAVGSSTMTGNTASIAANRISYWLDLHGPSMAIDTACSSSLFAFHQACLAIHSGEIDQALTGSVSLHLHPFPFIGFSKASMLSPHGTCKVFDAHGDGYVRAEGGGMFLLKELEQARADGDHVFAVVAGSGVNCDGRTNGVTVPNRDAQVRLIEETYLKAGVHPDEVDYVEAHGTGTAVGDPIETEAIGRALGRKRSKPLAIGSVKSNIGHLEAASGAAGLVKVLLCLEYREIPPTIHLHEPNPQIRFDDWNIAPVTELLPLDRDRVLAIGINSFGFGGANAHVLLQSAPSRCDTPSSTERPLNAPLMLSARSEAALRQLARDFASYLRTHNDISLYDIAYCAAHRRDLLEHRMSAFALDRGTLIGDLEAFAVKGEGDRIARSHALDAAAGPVFVYSGNGAQWAGMGRALIAECPDFRAVIAEVDAHFTALGGCSVLAQLQCGSSDDLQRTEIAQSTLFAIQVGITRVLAKAGVKPHAVLGHSVGEVAAAWASGALTLDQAVKVVYHRSAEQGKTKGSGGMTAVSLGPAETEDLLTELGLANRVTVAGVNSSQAVTLAGTQDHLTKVEAHLNQLGIFNKRLDLDYAFHSPAMEGIQQGITHALRDLGCQATQMSFISTVTGSLLAGEDLNADYWWQNIRRPVMFADAVHTIVAEGFNFFVEIGPHPILNRYVEQCLQEVKKAGTVITTMTRAEPGRHPLLRAVHTVFLTIPDVSLPILFPHPGRHLRLPGYPWQRERYWHPVTSESYGFLRRRPDHRLLGYRLSENSWQWENHLDLVQHPVYKDHVVDGATVFPAAGFVEMALAVAMAWQPETAADVEDFDIRVPLILDEKRVKTVRTELDSSDGSFRIKSRERLSDDPWLVNVTGRILRGTAKHRREPVFAPEQFVPGISAKEHYSKAHDLGLAYGPAFQTVSAIQVEKKFVFAALEAPKTIHNEMGESLLHPALLDGALQVLVALEQWDSGKYTAYVPVRMGRITLIQERVPPCYVEMHLTRRSPRSLQADFRLFAIDGSLVAKVDEARFRQLRFSSAKERLQQLAYYPIPQPLPVDQQCSPLPDLAVVIDLVRRQLPSPSNKAVLDNYYAEVEPLLDVLCGTFAYDALRPLTGDLARFDTQLLLQEGAIASNRQLLLHQMLQMLEEDEFITAETTGWCWNLNRDKPTAVDTWLTLLEDYPDYADRIIPLYFVGSRLSAILAGAQDANSLLPSLQAPAGWVDCAETTRRGLEAALTGLVLELSAISRRRLRVMELMQRSSALAPALLRHLDPDMCDFTLAVPAELSQGAAEDLKERYPGIAICTWTNEGLHLVERLPFDLILLPDGLTDLPNRMQLLVQFREALANQGLLLTLDQAPTRWLQILLAGRDVDKQPRNNWNDVLQGSGFSSVTSVAERPDEPGGPVLYLAQAIADQSTSSAVDSGTWILLCDSRDDVVPAGQDFAAALAVQLHARGVRSIRLNSAPAAELAQSLEAVRATAGPIAGVVHLVGLNTEGSTAKASLAAQEVRCLAACALLQAVETLQIELTLYLVTRNVHGRHFSVPINAADASLWGIGRTMVNEGGSVFVRLVDLCQVDDGDGFFSELLVAALATEISAPDSEDEVILTPGSRHALRLRPFVAGQDEKTKEESVVRLSCEGPGQLKHLLWQEVKLPPPAQGEVEIEVRATGLNFRDVMYAMGLLSDEAVENGFSGASLGMELSGIVRRLGPDVSDFQPGDEVIAFAPAAFATRVLSPASAVMHKPSGWSFAAGASILTTYFTAIYALHHLARVSTGERILIHGAAGGVGIAALRLARLANAEIFATAGTEQKREFARLLGADHVLDSRNLSFADEILEITGGEGVDVVLNSLAGEAINRNLRILRPFGRFLELGKRDYYENTRIGLRPFRNNISYFGIDADQLMGERPDLTALIIQELKNMIDANLLGPLPYRAFPAEDIVAAFRFMQQSRQIGKIVVTFGDRPDITPEKHPLMAKGVTLQPQGTYLVTGGLSGFGLATALWLADKGARHLVLIGRRGVYSPEAIRAIHELENRGIEVKATACDVTNRATLARLLEDIHHAMPPLRGVIHAATVIDDTLLVNMKQEQLHRVLAPKVLGACHLDELTRDLPLDFFVVYSSATTLFGNPGQGSYVAANLFLEALVAKRRQKGLAGLAVCWGVIDDVGFLARNPQLKELLLDRMGGTALQSAVALEILDTLLCENPDTAMGIIDLDWSKLKRFLPACASPKFREIMQDGDGSDDIDDSADLLRLLKELPADQVFGTILELLKAEVGNILRITKDKIEEHKSLYEMGMDSLMGVELVTALDQRFGIHLPVMALSEGPTIAKLTERIIDHLQGGNLTHSSTDVTNQSHQIMLTLSQYSTDLDGDVVKQVAEEYRTRLDSL